jgi:hypothetical protein
LPTVTNDTALSLVSRYLSIVSRNNIQSYNGFFFLTVTASVVYPIIIDITVV